MVTILDEAEVPIARGVSGRLLAKVIRGGKTQVCGCDLGWLWRTPRTRVGEGNCRSSCNRPSTGPGFALAPQHARRFDLVVPEGFGFLLELHTLVQRNARVSTLTWIGGE